ncbi:TolC family protein [Chitinophagaceae bacterium LB-8]|uniref:TolC family protein n=1 Tax=Paraflavisolibacter caeni TaxID=2982496 RepID=A0A9X2Y045_9BACT|nr:TolC family protein [Paraflavisolibacter caeni]MCU7552874.1 TolC family protein [Paraflavisolibacter caeni]
MKKVFITLLLFRVIGAYAQTNLDAYIKTALNNNETIKQQQFLLTKSLYVLKEAKSLFLPSVGFNATYTVADGGRKIDFPVGNLLNPVYKMLNQMTGTNNFPQVQNQSILLNPNNFYDAKIRTTYPILNAEIEYNRKIKKQQYDLQKIEISLYKRELVKEVKNAYYKYLQACEAVNIYQTALSLVKENLRVNTSLFNNQKVNRTAVVRSDNEVSKYNALLESSIQIQNNAKAYFNFLLNTDLNTEIIIDSINAVPVDLLLTDTTVAKREELVKLKEALAINQNITALAKSYKRPKLYSFVDLGTQAFDFKVNNKSFYYLAGISLEWNIFSGNKNKYKIRQAEADGKVLQSQTSYVEQQLKLQLTTFTNSFKAAIAQYNAAQSQVVSSQKYYNDIFRLYKEGMAIYIELLDAQNQWIDAQLQANIALFDTWISFTAIERANASFNLQ